MRYLKLFLFASLVALGISKASQSAVAADSQPETIELAGNGSGSECF